MYYKLKSSFLEDTLSQSLDDDGFDDIPYDDISSSQFEDTTSVDDSLSTTSFSNIHEINSPATLINIKNVDENHVVKHFEAEQTEQINENSWGSEVNNKQKNITKIQSNTDDLNKTRLSMTDKLFKNASFSKRNPRKTLLRSNSQSSVISSSQKTSSTAETLPDLETILNQKSLQREDDVKLMVKNIPLRSNINIDKRWLDRCTQNDSNCKEPEPNDESNSLKKPQFGLSNINTSNLKALYAQTQKNQSTSFGMSSLAIEHNIKSSYSSTVTQYDEDDEIIGNSEDDELTAKSNDASTFGHILKKRRLAASSTTTNKPIEKIPEQKNIEPSQLLQKPLGSSLKTVKESSQKIEIPEKYENNSSSDDELDEKPQKLKNSNRRTTKKKVSTRQSKRKDEKNLSLSDEPIAEEKPDQYVMEFGAKIRNVPQINIDELQNTNEMFESYLLDTTAARADDDNKNSKPATSTISAGPKTNREKLESKIEAGKLNENFVKINIQKKKFVRGKTSINFSRYKKTQWKNKKLAAASLAGPNMDMRGCDGGYQICFQCGKSGHFVQNCTVKCDRLLPIDAAAGEIEESSFRTLDEVEAMANAQASKVHANRPDKLPTTNKIIIVDDNNDTSIEQQMNEPSKTQYIGHKIPEDFLKKSGLLDAPTVSNSDTLKPLYDRNELGEISETTNEVYEALHMFGHKEFRKGQDRAIMRILSGMSTLVTLCTGSGKSLCYQLPAYLYRKHYKCITLVISPLVSLMEDQVHGVPNFLNAQCLHTNQNQNKRKQIIDEIQSGKVDILLISPEAIVAGEKSTGFGSLLRQLPPIAFVCIDEAHCVSQWSHNFRPSYLMICRVLKEKLKVSTVLGLTATATLQTR